MKMQDATNLTVLGNSNTEISNTATSLRAELLKLKPQQHLKPHQRTNRQKGCNLLSGSFFGSFLEKQKRTIQTTKTYKKKPYNFTATH
jgi:hypothetical protein